MDAFVEEWALIEIKFSKSAWKLHFLFLSLFKSFRGVKSLKWQVLGPCQEVLGRSASSKDKKTLDEENKKTKKQMTQWKLPTYKNTGWNF